MKNRSLNEMKFEHGCLVAPSILAADFSRLGEAISGVEDGGADLLHVDIMDGHFVPNLSMGPGVVSCIRKGSDLPFDVHLMLSEPGRYIEPFAKAGAQTIQIHVEADCDVHAELKRIRAMGLKNAIVINPETPVDHLFPYLDEIDEALVMTGHPGYGGQTFIAECLPKVTELRKRRPALDIMVDGGVNAETAVQAAKAGANQFVAGSYLFRQPDMKAAVEAMRAEVSA